MPEPRSVLKTQIQTPGETPRPKKRFAGLKQLLGLAVIAWLGYYLYTRRETLLAVVDADPWQLAAIGVLVLVTWALMSLQATVLLRSIGTPVGYGEHLALQLASNIVNYLPLRMGPVLRIHYLKSLHGLHIAHFGSLVGVRAILLVLACGLTGLTAEVLGGLGGEERSLELLFIFSGLIAAALGAFFLPLPRFAARSGRLVKLWREIADGVALARARPRRLLLVLVLIELQLLAVAARLSITFESVSFTASPALSIKVAALAALVNLLAFTMGSLGLREAVIGYATAASGHDFSTGVFAGVVDRAMLLGLTYPLGLICLAYVTARLRRGSSGSRELPGDAS